MRRKCVVLIMALIQVLLSIFLASCNHNINGVVGEETTGDFYHNDGVDNSVNIDSEHQIVFSVESNIDFANIDMSSIDRIVIKDGTDGSEKELNTIENIERIVDMTKHIKGESPVSNKGYSGFTYFVKFYCGNNEIFSFSLFPNDDDSVALICGNYETFGGVDYPCRYILTDCSYEFIDSVLKEFAS